MNAEKVDVGKQTVRGSNTYSPGERCGKMQRKVLFSIAFAFAFALWHLKEKYGGKQRDVGKREIRIERWQNME